MNIVPVAAMVVAGLALGGCASIIPSFDIPKGPSGAPTVKSIRLRVVCELEEIAMGTELEQNVSDLEDVDVSVQLTLDVTDDGALAPTFNYTAGVFSFGTGFKLEQSREQNFTEWLFYNMREIKKRAQTDSGWKKNCEQPIDTNLSGRLGLRESFDLAMTANPDLNWKETGTSGVFGGYVTFIVKQDLTATGPTWSLTHFKGPGAFGTLSDDHNDKLFFAFTKGSGTIQNKSTTAVKVSKVTAKATRETKVAREIAKSQGIAFISNLIQTQLGVSLGSINQSLH